MTPITTQKTIEILGNRIVFDEQGLVVDLLLFRRIRYELTENDSGGNSIRSGPYQVEHEVSVWSNLPPATQANIRSAVTEAIGIALSKP